MAAKSKSKPRSKNQAKTKSNVKSPANSQVFSSQVLSSQVLSSQSPTTNINVFDAKVLADPHHYQQNRQRIRHQKNEQMYQNLWRIASVIGIAALAGWGATLPDWNLRSASQIKIEGNQLLPTDTLVKMVPIAFPQSIFTVQPQAIAAQIEKIAPVDRVKVERTLFPAQLVISLSERKPVAKFSRKGEIGLIDAAGKALPTQVYPDSLQKPDLLVLVDSQALISNSWYSFYKVISGQNLGVSLVDWRDPNNVILTTRLFAKVHLGVYSEARFSKQAVILNQIQSSSFNQNLAEAKIGKISHLDLSDPQYPLIERSPVEAK
jgi:cell division protein FtsQ